MTVFPLIKGSYLFHKASLNFPIGRYLTHNSFIHSTALAATKLVDVMVLHVRFQTFMVYYGILFATFVRHSLQFHEHLAALPWFASASRCTSWTPRNARKAINDWHSSGRAGTVAVLRKCLEKFSVPPEMIVVARHLCVVYMRPCSVSSSM